tara:strand:- start:3142 stop:4782 length:1641 start_codon:yes stop_codon:yes gene_type:complete
MQYLLYIVLFTILGAIDTVKVDTAKLSRADTSNAENITITSSIDPFLNQVVEEDIFESQMSEAKSIYAEAIISDLTGDTLEAAYQFELLFEALANIEVLSKDDEFQTLEFNRVLTAAIDYYEDEAITIDKVETGLSVAVLRDKLNEYVYGQKLEELEYVEERVEIIPGHIPITYNQKVASIIKFFQKQGRSSFQKWLNRMAKYKLIILPILEEEGVPTELFYLAMIESGLNPKAYSYAHASGVWQFIASTGKMYGLKKNWWVDERRDFEKATRAATHYLKDLYIEFGDWYLAFAAYNCGSARVKKEMRRHNTDDYWKLKRLPPQTRNYVPNIMAAIFIANNPQKYGFYISSEESFEWEMVDIDKTVSLEVLAQCAKLDIGVLQAYNPELKQATLPPLKEGQVYPFRLPTKADVNFDSLLSEVEVKIIEEVVFIDHKVKYGENLWLIAKKYNVRIHDIVSINKLARTKYIHPGQVLQIPTDGYDIYRKAAMKKSSGSKQIYYTVRYGDTLSGIAVKYRTSVRKIKKWNGLRSDRIYKGQKLKIWTKA